MMHRRELLLGAVGAGATSCAGVLPAAQADTPVMRLFREWEVYYRWICDTPMSESECDRHMTKAGEIADRLLSIEPQGHRDILAKLSALTYLGDDLRLQHPAGGQVASELRQALAA